MDFSREELSNRLLQEFVEEEDEFPEQEAGWNIKVMVPLIAFAVLGFMFFAWRADKIAISRNVGSEVPLVKADTTPVREKPDDPGGMYIANRDKQVYDAISSDGVEKELPKVIRVLPEPEEPLARDVIKGGTPPAEVAKVEETPAVHAAVPAEIKAESPAKVEPEKIEAATSSPAKIETAAAEKAGQKEVLVKQELMSKDIEVKNEEEIPVVAAKEATVPTKSLTVKDIKVVPVLKNKDAKAVVELAKKHDNSYKIQLGSFRSEADVKTTWNKLKKEYSDLFKGTELYTEKADLGEKGIFYRLQATKIKSESDARKICQKLIENKQGCFVVKK
jgi:cell division septation protein DedD